MEERFIGELGREHDAGVVLKFGYFGSRLRVHPDACELDYLDYLGAAAKIDDSEEREGFDLTMDFLRKQIHPDDFDEFWALSRKNKQGLQDIMQTSQTILEATSGFPSEQPPDSSPPSPTPTTRRTPSKKSKVALSSTAAAFTHLEGRPDLKQAVALAQSRGGSDN